MPRERRVVDERVGMHFWEIQSVVAGQFAHQFPREPGTDIREEDARADEQYLRRLRASPLAAAVARVVATDVVVAKFVLRWCSVVGRDDGVGGVPRLAAVGRAGGVVRGRRGRLV